MAVITVVDGALYQWDTGRKLHIALEASESIQLVHYSNGDGVECTPHGQGVSAPIPNSLLQQAQNFTAFAVCVSADGTRTVTSRVIPVTPKAKPNDYIYTPTEVRTWESLDLRLGALEAATPNWDAAQGEPGHIQGRTHYAEEGMVQMELPGQWVDMDEGQWAYIVTVPLGLEEGKTYTVCWNGTDYICTARKLSTGETVLGDIAAIDEQGESTGEPFVIIEYATDFDGIYGLVGSLPDFVKDVPFQVFCEGQVFHPLDIRYLPVKALTRQCAQENIYNVYFTMTLSGEKFKAATEQTFAQVYAKVTDHNVTVRAYGSLLGNIHVYQLAAYNDEKILFSLVSTSSTGTGGSSIQMNADGTVSVW